MTTGDAQTGPAAGTLALPLTVTVTGSDGRPFRGATVTWQVVSGGGTVNPSTSASDSLGQAGTELTLGLAFGVNTVTATVAGVPPVTFTAQAIDPCLYNAPYTDGTTLTAALSTIDCRFVDGSYIDYYRLNAASQLSVQVSETAPAFDAFLWLFDNVDFALAADDDGGGGTNATMRLILGPGTYRIGANSFMPDETGAYTLSSSALPVDAGGCAEVWVTAGIVTSQQILASDCTDGAGSYADAFLLALPSGRSVTITERSSGFDAYLLLFFADGTLVAFDDDSGGGSDARLSYTASESGPYIIIAATYSPGETGAYTLSIQ
ncbi:MAG: Ig-like domain-containing protein [Gemmatimonadetes bacterium]|nr:Ig-like domain-containing protein [Gemmatimonadota bacterium]